MSVACRKPAPYVASVQMTVMQALPGSTVSMYISAIFQHPAITPMLTFTFIITFPLMFACAAIFLPI